MKGIGTCKLALCGGRSVLLHDILYAPRIRQNLVSVSVLLGLGYILNFYGISIDIYYGSIFYGAGCLFNGFFVLDYDYYGSSYVNSCFSLIASSCNVNVDVKNWHARLGHVG